MEQQAGFEPGTSQPPVWRPNHCTSKIPYWYISIFRYLRCCPCSGILNFFCILPVDSNRTSFIFCCNSPSPMPWVEDTCKTPSRNFLVFLKKDWRQDVNDQRETRIDLFIKWVKLKRVTSFLKGYLMILFDS